MNILLLSAYDADSHQYWRQGLVENLPQFKWTILTLPPRYFSWRIRGNPLSWIYQHPDIFSNRYDAVVATSMVDLATLKGLVPALAQTPSLVYFHENQFEYPKNKQQHSGVDAQMVSLYSALAADRIVFNSTFNRTSFLTGVEKLLDKLPDQVPRGIVHLLDRSSPVIPVPLDRHVFKPQSTDEKPDRLTLVWNHRWEYDKAPERLYAALCRVKAKGIRFNLRILGKSFRNHPEIFQRIKLEFSEQLINFGSIKHRRQYLAALRASHAVISTAIHDFQGLSVLEAVAAGCVPLVPDRLAYPEFLPQSYRYDSQINQPELEAQALTERIVKIATQHHSGNLPTAPNVNHLSWDRLNQDYQHQLESLVSHTSSTGSL